MRCSYCKRDLDVIHQDNMSYSLKTVVCEDCADIGTGNSDGCPDDCSKCGDFCVYDDKEISP